jgi:hypothetical protein
MALRSSTGNPTHAIDALPQDVFVVWEAVDHQGQGWRDEGLVFVARVTLYPDRAIRRLKVDNTL